MNVDAMGSGKKRVSPRGQALLPFRSVQWSVLFPAALVVVGGFLLFLWVRELPQTKEPFLPDVFAMLFWIHAVLGVVVAGLGLWVLRTTGPEKRGLVAFLIRVPIVGGLLMGVWGTLLTHYSTLGYVRGRQLRRRGRILLPGVISSDHWSCIPMTVPSTVERTALASEWRENGRTEHASVAAFARMTLDLVALGAPPRLLAAAQQDAQDELRHTELCFSLARALDGKHASPGPFPEIVRAGNSWGSRPLALVQLAVTSLIDGALHEGLSARIVAKLAKRCELPAIREVLKEIAADEGRHAAHGWDVVEWCLREGGTPVASALRGAVDALPRAMTGARPNPSRWEAFGLPSEALQQEEYLRAREDVQRRVNALLRRTPPESNAKSA
jgi:hypothetical protein